MGSIDGKLVTTHGDHESRAGTARGHSCPQRRSKTPWRAWLAAGWKARAPAGGRFMESHLFQKELLTGHEPVSPAFLPAIRRLESRRYLRFMGHGSSRRPGHRMDVRADHDGLRSQ